MGSVKVKRMQGKPMDRRRRHGAAHYTSSSFDKNDFDFSKNENIRNIERNMFTVAGNAGLRNPGIDETDFETHFNTSISAKTYPLYLCIFF